MKKLVALIILTITIFASQADFKYFTSKSLGDDVLLEWSLEDESNVKHFKIQRQIKSGSTQKYIYVSSLISPEGNGTHYRYTDENLFIAKGSIEKPENESIKVYRVEITLADGSKLFSDESVVTHNINSVKKTWGMLKEMFR